MKSIGFVDYYLSEWHADNYPEWIAEATKKLGFEYELRYAWAEEYISPIDGVNTDEWCKKYNVQRCATIEELCEKSDAIIILAPSNPEKHIEYAKKVLPFSKPTYIDKPFAESVESASYIFELAEKYNTRFFSSSALRYANELDEADNCVAVSTQGGGSNLEEYIIHQAEMLVKKLGIGACKLKAEKLDDNLFNISVRYSDERAGSMRYIRGGVPFTITMSEHSKNEAVYKTISSDFFLNLITDIINFFETGEISFDTNETLEVNKLVVATIKAKNSPEEWILV